MAKKRRSYQVNSSDYNIAGGGGGASGGNVRFSRKDLSAVAAGGTGVTYTPGTKQVARPVKISLEAGLQVTNTQRNESQVYYEHAFENINTSATQVTDADELPSGYGTALPNGMSMDVDTDQGNGDAGYVRISQTTLNSNATPGTYKFRYKVDQGGWGANYIDYEVDVWPQNTTPVFSNTNITIQRIIRNETAKQYLTDTVTASQAIDFNLTGVTGFPTGVEPKIEKTGANAGRVYVENTPDTGIVAASAHSFNIEINLGQYGTFTQAFSGNIAYGDVYGAAYFGPGSAMTNPTSYGAAYTGYKMTTTDYNTLWNPLVSSGALRCRTNSQYSTSPYKYNEPYGLVYSEGWGYSNGSTGYLGPKCSSNTNTSSDGHVVRFDWTVPNGVESFCVVACGAGCGGSYSWAADGGSGAGVAWVNDVTCTPGETFEIAVGLGRRSFSSPSSYWGGSTWMRRVADAGNGANEFIVIGYGGGYQSGHGVPLNGRSNPQSSNLYHTESYNYNNSRDSGSAAASTKYGGYGAYYGGRGNSYAGAAAAGYQGNGASSNNNNGNGGGPGAGDYYSSTWGCSAGGGIGLDGRGAGGNDGSGSGYGGTQGAWTSNYETDGTNSYYYGGGGGSGGSRGCYGENNYTGNGGINNRYINGGMHGGGGGGSGTSWGGGAGGMGGIRIIWGSGRSFPYTYTTEDPGIQDSRNPGDGR